MYLYRFPLHSRVSVCLLALCTRFEPWQLPCSPAGRAEQWGTPDGFAAPAFPPPSPSFSHTFCLAPASPGNGVCLLAALSFCQELFPFLHSNRLLKRGETLWVGG